MSVTALPEQLSEPAREFAARQHQLLIDGEQVPAADGRTFETIDPATFGMGSDAYLYDSLHDTGRLIGRGSSYTFDLNDDSGFYVLAPVQALVSGACRLFGMRGAAAYFAPAP